MHATIETPKDLGRLVRRIRTEFGLTQRELAETLQMSQRYVYELEAGKPKRADATYFEVLAKLGIRLTATVDTGAE